MLIIVNEDIRDDESKNSGKEWKKEDVKESINGWVLGYN
jgi:hypothetical protein